MMGRHEGLMRKGVLMHSAGVSKGNQGAFKLALCKLRPRL